MASTSAVNSSIALSGLASGIDWTSIVNELLTIERAPETQMQAQQTTYNQKNAAYQALGTKISTLASDVNTLSDPTFFDNRITNVADPSVVSATAAAGTAEGNYTFNIIQLATDASQQGSTGIASALSTSSDVSGLTLSSAGFAHPVTAGTFTVNGTAINVATTDTLGTVLNKIGTAIGGTASYDPGTDEITLSGSGPITLGSATDTSNFLQDAQLYNNGTNTITSTSALGAINMVGVLSSANFASAIDAGTSSPDGSFEINGVTINYNTSTDAVSDVLNRINNSAAGVTATYDSVNGRFQVTNKTTGDVGITLQDLNGGNFLAATGLSTGTLERGSNLQYSVNNGGTLTSESNIISGTSSGITGLSVTALAQGKQTTVTVGSDTSTISSAISQFVTDYNAVQNLISTDITPTTNSSGDMVPALLTGDFDTEGVGTQLRLLADASPSGLTGTLHNLMDLGIDSNGTDNTLSLDNPALLNSALTGNLDAVKQLFTDPTNGIATQLQSYLGSATSATGLLSNQGALAKDEATMTKESTDITTSITQLEQRISQDQTRLTNEFVAMETAINTINSEKQYLNAFLSSSASSNAAPQAAGSNINSSSSSSSSSSG